MRRRSLVRPSAALLVRVLLPTLAPARDAGRTTRMLVPISKVEPDR